MSIRSVESYLDSVWDWAVVDGCLGPNPGNSPQDIDGFCEHRRRFLFIETKPLQCTVPRGQESGFCELSNLPGIIIVWLFGPRNRAREMWLTVESTHYKIKNICNEDFRTFLKGWYVKAELGHSPSLIVSDFLTHLQQKRGITHERVQYVG